MVVLDVFEFLIGVCSISSRVLACLCGSFCGLGLPLLVCGPPSARVQLYIPQIKFGGYGFV